MTSDGDAGVEFRDEEGASPWGWGLRARLWHTSEQGLDWEGHKREEGNRA